METNLVNKILYNQKIVEFSYEGYGLIRYNGFPILVENALKDEIVDIKIMQQNSKFALGKIIEQHIKSPLRISVENKELLYSYNAPLLILNYKDQLKFKTDIVKNMFSRELNYSNILNCKESKKHFNYRNKITLHIEINKEIKIGFFVRNTHQIIEQTKYDLVNEKLAKIIEITTNFFKREYESIRLWKLFSIVFRYSEKANEAQIIFNSTNIPKLETTFFNRLLKLIKTRTGLFLNIFDREQTKLISQKVLSGKENMLYKIGRQRYFVSFDSFFQVNEEQTKAIFDHIAKESRFKGDELVIDCYAGVGAIGLYIAKKVKNVISVENVKNATVNAKANAKLNRINNFETYCMDTVRYFDTFIEKQKDIDAVIFDPPRGGLNQIIINETINKNVKKIIYLSCNPHTLVRDVKMFVAKNYEIKFVQPFDMFPQTQHIETLCILEKK